MDDLNWKAALVDLHRTLLDTESQYSRFWGRIGETYQPEMPDFAQRIKGTTLADILQRYFPDSQVQEQVVAQLNEWEANMLYSFFPGALEFVADIRMHGVQTALVTSSNQNKMNAMMKCHPDFSGLFDSILTAESFAASKPDPSCYLLAAEVLQRRKDECVVFEDALSGLQAGMSSGMFTVGLPNTMDETTVKGHCHIMLPSFQGIDHKRFTELFKQ